MEQHQINKAWKSGVKCEQCGIRDLVLFSDLTKSDFELIHRPINDFDLKVGATLYSQGDSSDAIFTLRHGLVKLVSYLVDGTVRIVRVIKKGDVVGLEALDNKNYFHHAVVLEDASFCRIPVSQIETLNEHSPHLAKQLTRRWQRVIYDADFWLSQLSSGFAKQRVAYLLLYLSEGNEKQEVYLPSREDMGAMLAITTETASRVVASFKRDGIISPVSTHRVLLDKARLTELCES